MISLMKGLRDTKDKRDKKDDRRHVSCIPLVSFVPPRYLSSTEFLLLKKLVEPLAIGIFEHRRRSLLIVDFGAEVSKIIRPVEDDLQLDDQITIIAGQRQLKPGQRLLQTAGVDVRLRAGRPSYRHRIVPFRMAVA